VQFYESTIKPFTRQVYPDLGPANLVGYGMCSRQHVGHVGRMLMFR
jgi:hypothetical protein